MFVDNSQIWSTFKTVHLDFRKEEKGEMAMTYQRCVAKQGFAGLMSVLMMKNAASTESKFLSLNMPVHGGHTTNTALARG
jgi:hypothetical protein